MFYEAKVYEITYAPISGAYNLLSLPFKVPMGDLLPATMYTGDKEEKECLKALLII